jgi:hypothetical protein
VALILWSTVPNWFGFSSEEHLLWELIAGHVRSLMVDHLIDVSASDPHAVEPWFEEKLSFSPKLFDLRGQGFRWVGGRLDDLQGKRIAALAYQRRQQITLLRGTSRSSFREKLTENLRTHLLRVIRTL